MRKKTQTIISAKTAWWMISAIVGLCAPSARADAPQSESPNTTLVYFVRHAEDVPELVGSDPSFTVTFNNCNLDGSCCEEALNSLGKVRATVLADWFEEKGLTSTLTHVIASHKLRTRQTVAGIAQRAGLGGDVDQAPGDGVINVPPISGECDPGWTSSSSVTQPQINFIATLPVGSRAVVCSHSPVLYPLMQAFGIDTSDSVKFPKDSRGRVSGFSNLWIVELQPTRFAGALAYQGRLLEHVRLDFQLEKSSIDRDYGNAPGRGSRDDD
ncbi:MAG: histidine phosphatase family protein [Verrucomicrobia subdivision 3 bacterium]|nr:histidine phosphatase family protein [Limisphaerales bacterium]